MPVFTVILSRLILGESQSPEVSKCGFTIIHWAFQPSIFLHSKIILIGFIYFVTYSAGVLLINSCCWWSDDSNCNWNIFWFYWPCQCIASHIHFFYTKYIYQKGEYFCLRMLLDWNSISSGQHSLSLPVPEELR